MVLTAAVSHLGFQLSLASTPSFYLLVFASTLALGVYGALRLQRAGDLASLLRPAWGDFTKGFFGAAVLFAAVLAFRHVVLPPGSVREGWIARVYLQLGGPADLRAHLTALGVVVFLATASEEIFWRGFVIQVLEPYVGSRRAWVVAAVLYATAHLPTVWALRDSAAGPNPLVVLVALAGGLLWGAMARALGRLPPVLLAHALFDWCVLVLFRLWGGGF